MSDHGGPSMRLEEVEEEVDPRASRNSSIDLGTVPTVRFQPIAEAVSPLEEDEVRELGDSPAYNVRLLLFPKPRQHSDSHGRGGDPRSTGTGNPCEEIPFEGDPIPRTAAPTMKQATLHDEIRHVDPQLGPQARVKNRAMALLVQLGERRWLSTMQQAIWIH